MAARMFRWLIRSRAVQIVWILMWESEHQEILFQERQNESESIRDDCSR